MYNNKQTKQTLLHHQNCRRRLSIYALISNEKRKIWVLIFFVFCKLFEKSKVESNKKTKWTRMVNDT